MRSLNERLAVGYSILALLPVAFLLPLAIHLEAKYTDNDISVDRCYDQAVAPHPPMSEEQLKAFLEKVKGDTSLKEKLKAASDADGVVAIAKEAGFSISADDLKNAQSEVSDEELEGAAGGRRYLTQRNGGLIVVCSVLAC